MTNWVKQYINNVEKDIPFTKVTIKKNIKNYISTASVEIPNPQGIFNSYFSINMPYRIDLYDKTSDTYITKIVGYIDSIAIEDTTSKLTLQISQYSGRMYQRRANKVYKHWTAYNIIKDLADVYLPEFTSTNVEYDGTDTISEEQDSTDGTVTLDGANKKYAQQFMPTEENIVKISIFVEDNASGIADIQLRAEDTGLPSDYDILQSVQNVTLADGENVIYLTRKFLDTTLNYWICVNWKGGSFKLSTNGAVNTGRVAYSSASPESWATQNVSDLRFKTYTTTAKIIEIFKLAQKTLAEGFEDLVKIFTIDKIFYIDNNRDLNWKTETFVSSSQTFDDSNIWNISNSNEGRKIFNNVTIMGGEEYTYNSTDSFLGNGTQKTFSFSAGNPVKPLKKVTVNGTVKVENTDFTVNYDTHQISFGTAPANGHAIVIIHDYTLPVIANSKNVASVSSYGQADYVKSDKNIESTERAKEIADGLLRLYSNPEDCIKIDSFIYPFIDCGEFVKIENTRLDINDNYLVSEITFEVGSKLTMNLSLANEEIVAIPDVLKELKAKIEEVQMAQYKLDAPVTELYEMTGSVTFTAEITIDENFICDSFILGHTTDNGKLGRGEILDLFSDVSNFTSGEFDVSENTDTDYIKAGTKSILVESDSTQTGYITSTDSYGDLSGFVGVASGQTSEGVVGLWLYVADEGNVNDIKIRIGSSSSDYVEATGSFVGFKNDGWNYILFKLKNIAPTGTPDWENVDYIRIQIDAEKEDYYLNYLTIGDGDSIGLNGLGRRELRRTIL